MPVCVGKVQVLSVENLLQVSLQILLYCIHEWQDETHLTDSLTAPPLLLRGGSDGPVSSFQSVGSSVNILPTCRSVEVRHGNVLRNVGMWGFVVFTILRKKVNVDPIKSTLWEYLSGAFKGMISIFEKTS